MEDKPEIILSDPVIIKGRTKNLDFLESDFKRYHFGIIDLTNKDKKH